MIVFWKMVWWFLCGLFSFVVINLFYCRNVFFIFIIFLKILRNVLVIYGIVIFIFFYYVDIKCWMGFLGFKFFYWLGKLLVLVIIVGLFSMWFRDFLLWLFWFGGICVFLSLVIVLMMWLLRSKVLLLFFYWGLDFSFLEVWVVCGWFFVLFISGSVRFLMEF